jgi:thymidine phosphorylase
VTATVESIPLITASILSKKLAAGLQGLVMDVKTGSGAFMAALEDSRALALSLAEVATEAGLPTVSLITDMNQPLASAAGNAVETLHAIDHLLGAAREPRVQEVVVALGAEMLLLGGLARDLDEARCKIEAALDSGAAAERFARMVSALGGPADLLERPRHHLPEAPVTLAVTAQETGHVRVINTRAVGLAVVALGGGRTRPQDPIDHAVGLTRLAGLGAPVGPGQPLALVHARSMEAAQEAAARVLAAYEIGEAPQVGPVMVERLAG